MDISLANVVRKRHKLLKKASFVASVSVDVAAVSLEDKLHICISTDSQDELHAENDSPRIFQILLNPLIGMEVRLIVLKVVR